MIDAQTVAAQTDEALKMAMALTSQKPDPILKPEWRSKWIGLEERDSDTVRMVEAVQLFCLRMARNDIGRRLLVVAGTNGVGKTVCAHRAVSYLNAAAHRVWLKERWWPRPPTSAFVEWADIALTSDAQKELRWHDLVHKDFLAIDDIGAEVDQYRNNMPTRNLAQMLNAREGKWTMVTTNFPEERWEATWDKRVADRLHRDSVIVTMRQCRSYWNPYKD